MMNGYQLVCEALHIIKQSKISGKGAFSTSSIRKGTNIGLAFTHIKNTGNPDKDYTRSELGIYANHSSKPNLKLHIKGKEVHYITLQNIRRGEEFTIDYSTFPWEGERDFK